MAVRLCVVGHIKTVVTTTFQMSACGMVHEHITIDVPDERARENPRLKMLRSWEQEHDMMTGSMKQPTWSND